MRKALTAVATVALGHLASVALVAGAALQGMTMGRAVMLGVAALAGVMLAAGCLHRHPTAGGAPGRARPVGWLLVSFVVTTLHGAGLALVPALLPLCLPADPAHAGVAGGVMSEALWRVLAACTVHSVVMLLAGSALTWAIGRGRVALRPRRQVRLSPSCDPTLHPP